MSPMLFFKFLSFFGIFPVRMSADGLPTNRLSIFLTLLSITFGLSYFIGNSDYIWYTVEKSQLSRVLTALPHGLAAILTEFLIRVSSIRYCNQFIKFLALTSQQSNSLHNSESLMKYFWMLPMLYSACSLTHLIGHGILYTDTGVSYTTLKSGSDWDRLLAFWIIINDVLHDCSILSSICFVVHYGKRVTSSFELLCEEMLKICQAAAAHRSSSAVQFQNQLKALAPLESESSHAERLINMFSDAKIAFGIYSKIGGTFIFALVLDAGTWIYYSACTALFGHPIAGAPLYYVVSTMYCVASAINLCVIAELGHQMASKVIVPTLCT